jgi:hypothetical protein
MGFRRSGRDSASRVIDATARHFANRLSRMRYFFHLEDGVCISDRDGEELPDNEAAMRQAAQLAKDLSKNRTRAHSWHVVVKNAVGIRIGQVPLTLGPTAAVTLSGR